MRFFVPGARYPLAGLLLALPALPALEGTGLLQAAGQVYGRLKDGYYGLAATLLTLVFLALAGEPRAEGATRIPPGAMGRVLGLDPAPEVKTIRRRLGELAAAGKTADLIMALARRHAAARPEALGFLHVDGHARVYHGTRTVQKTHIARLKFPAPATVETWVTDAGGDPVFMVVAEPSESLAGELRRLLPGLRAVAGEGRRVTVCFDRAAGVASRDVAYVCRVAHAHLDPGARQGVVDRLPVHSVASIATSVTLAPPACHLPQRPAKRLEPPHGHRALAGPLTGQPHRHQITFLCTSIPATREWTTSMAILWHALAAAIRGYPPGGLQRQSSKQARSAKVEQRQRAAQPQVSPIRGRGSISLTVFPAVLVSRSRRTGSDRRR